MDWQKDIKSINNGSKLIHDYIISTLNNNKGGIIGRNGSTELTLILYHDHNKKINNIHIEMLERYSGVFKFTEEWIDIYKKAIESCDIFAGGWYPSLARQELKYLEKYKMPIIPLRSLEPYYVDNNWLTALNKQRVTVVSSFANTMREQINKQIWDKFPDASWSFVRSYFCPSIAQGKCEWPDGINTWNKAVDYLEEEILKTNPRIVIVGCGGLAMPLALKLKQRNIITIIMGGAIQILFGIKGRRWEDHPIISSFFNHNWVFPSDDEIPNGADKIEEGCYW